MKSIQLFILCAFTVTLLACGPDYSYEEDYVIEAYEIEMEEMEMKIANIVAEGMAISSGLN